MPRGREHKDRLLKVLRILQDETDKDHRLTVTQLIEKLELSDDLNTRRKVCDDLDALRDSGFPLASERHKTTEYYLDERELRAKELMVLIDIVQSSRSIEEDQANGLVDSILSLGSSYEAEDVRKMIYVGDRVHLPNDELFDSIWMLRKAIRNRRKVRFRYFNYTFEYGRHFHRNRKGEELLIETPVEITCTGGIHYVITKSDEKEKPTTRRIDRMVDVQIDSSRSAWSIELQQYAIDHRSLFNMYSGEKKCVTLRIKEQAMNALIDQFGEKMDIRNKREVVEDGKTVRYADVRVTVQMSPQFMGWVRGMEGLVELVK